MKPPIESTHHLVKFIHLEMQTQGLSQTQLAKLAGLDHQAVYRAFQTRYITLANAEAMLNALGYTTKPTPLRPVP